MISSNSATRGPRLSWPDHNTRVTRSTSRSVISGQESGTFIGLSFVEFWPTELIL